MIHITPWGLVADSPQRAAERSMYAFARSGARRPVPAPVGSAAVRVRTPRPGAGAGRGSAARPGCSRTVTSVTGRPWGILGGRCQRRLPYAAGAHRHRGEQHQGWRSKGKAMLIRPTPRSGPASRTPKSTVRRLCTPADEPASTPRPALGPGLDNGRRCLRQGRICPGGHHCERPCTAQRVTKGSETFSMHPGAGPPAARSSQLRARSPGQRW
jgi:hypothetical protein